MTTKAELTARMTAPGGAFEMVEETVNGLPMRVYKDAPASMRDVFLGTEDFADRVCLALLGAIWCLIEAWFVAKGQGVESRKE